MIRREFELSNGRKFVVTWSEPKFENGDYRCDFSFTLEGEERRASTFGVDSVQALLLAMQRAHVELLSSPQGRRAEIKWLGMTDLGLPLPMSLSACDFLHPDAKDRND